MESHEITTMFILKKTLLNMWFISGNFKVLFSIGLSICLCVCVHKKVKQLETLALLATICDLMGQNQSHVAIFVYGVKYTSFRPHSVLQIGEN